MQPTPSSPPPPAAMATAGTLTESLDTFLRRTGGYAPHFYGARGKGLSTAVSTQPVDWDLAAEFYQKNLNVLLEGECNEADKFFLWCYREKLILRVLERFDPLKPRGEEGRKEQESADGRTNTGDDDDWMDIDDQEEEAVFGSLLRPMYPLPSSTTSIAASFSDLKKSLTAAAVKEREIAEKAEKEVNLLRQTLGLPLQASTLPECAALPTKRRATPLVSPVVATTTDSAFQQPQQQQPGGEEEPKAESKEEEEDGGTKRSFKVDIHCKALPIARYPPPVLDRHLLQTFPSVSVSQLTTASLEHARSGSSTPTSTPTAPGVEGEAPVPVAATEEGAGSSGGNTNREGEEEQLGDSHDGDGADSQVNQQEEQPFRVDIHRKVSFGNLIWFVHNHSYDSRSAPREVSAVLSKLNTMRRLDDKELARRQAAHRLTHPDPKRSAMRRYEYFVRLLERSGIAFLDSLIHQENVVTGFAVKERGAEMERDVWEAALPLIIAQALGPFLLQRFPDHFVSIETANKFAKEKLAESRALLQEEEEKAQQNECADVNNASPESSSPSTECVNCPGTTGSVVLMQPQQPYGNGGGQFPQALASPNRDAPGEWSAGTGNDPAGAMPSSPSSVGTPSGTPSASAASPSASASQQQLSEAQTPLPTVLSPYEDVQPSPALPLPPAATTQSSARPPPSFEEFEATTAGNPVGSLSLVRNIGVEKKVWTKGPSCPPSLQRMCELDGIIVGSHQVLFVVEVKRNPADLIHARAQRIKLLWTLEEDLAYVAKGGVSQLIFTIDGKKQTEKRLWGMPFFLTTFCFAHDFIPNAIHSFLMVTSDRGPLAPPPIAGSIRYRVVELLGSVVARVLPLDALPVRVKKGKGKSREHLSQREQEHRDDCVELLLPLSSAQKDELMKVALTQRQVRDINASLQTLWVYRTKGKKTVVTPTVMFNELQHFNAFHTVIAVPTARSSEIEKRKEVMTTTKLTPRTIVLVLGILMATLLGTTTTGQLSSGALQMAPTKTYQRAINASRKAEAELNVCRAAAARTGENLADLRCFEKAVQAFEYNATWAKQLAALAMMTAQRQLGYKYFNRSAQIVLEAQAFVNMSKLIKDNIPFDPEILLKLYYRREKESSVELAKVWSQSLQMDQQLNTSATILEEFVVPLGHLAEAIVVHRNIGNLIRTVDLLHESKLMEAMAAHERKKKRSKKMKPFKNKLAKIVLLAEEIGTSAEQLAVQWLSSVLTATEVGLKESNDHSKHVCGVPLPRKRSYTVNEIVRYLSTCVAKWGKFDEYLQKERANLARPVGAIMRTVAHQLASVNAEYMLRKLIEVEPSLLTARDNFGRTPLHQAVVHQQDRIIKLLVELGGTKLLQEKDAGNISPMKLACTIPNFRETFEALELGLPAPDAGRTLCGNFGKQDVVHDETSEDYEDMFKAGGGWKNATRKFVDEEECDFDVRTADSMSHHELIGRYLHSSRPVVLRGTLPSKLINKLKRKKLEKNFGKVLLRRELFPTSEHFGVPIEKVQNISSYLKNTTRVFGTIEMSKKHPLLKTMSWIPERLFPPQEIDEETGKTKQEGYITLGDSYPLLVLSGSFARTNNVARTQHFFFVNVFGEQEWRLHRPPIAKTSGERVNFSHPDSEAAKCRLRSGDALIVPMLWSASWRTKGESVGFMSRFIWK